ncbi:hypothetical protein [Alloprevotella tannerae]|uniref:hypothetical protein n=1 Tax=Alloprevotella tannerae TaxID=76122 RepID=UPI0028EDCEC1|nr:hypothetical protein [Alloprevotella tannerae]
MRKSTLFTSFLAMFVAIANSFAQSAIELTTDMSVGSEFQIFLEVGEGEQLKIDGLNGKFNNGDWSLVKLTKQKVRIEGKIKYLGIDGNQITSFKMKDMEELVSLGLKNNKLTEIDLSGAPALKRVSVGKNKLEALDLSNNTFLHQVYAYGNKIKGEKMTALVNSLPGGTASELFLVDKTLANEENLATKADVQIARNKGWNVFNYQKGQYTVYDGEGETGIEFINQRAIEVNQIAGSDFATLTVPHKMLGSTYAIYNLNGAKLAGGIITSDFTRLPLNNVPLGAYLLKVGNKVEKLIKK